MVRQIPLPRGAVTLVDDEDYERLARYRWCRGGGGYACRETAVDGRGSKRITIYMHREVFTPPEGMEVDHINRDPLDNRRSNLRAATRGQNLANRLLPNKSGFVGVYCSKKGHRWSAYVFRDGRKHFFGNHHTPEEAARARDKGALKLHGAFAVLNFPEHPSGAQR